MIKARAFTLIELLVVVTIIILMLALLMPAMETAINRAEMVTCNAHQRQIVVGWQSYLGDNMKTLPGAHTFRVDYDWVVTPFAPMDPPYYESEVNFRAGTMAPYLSSLAVYKCPGEPRRDYLRSYAFSNFAGGSGWNIQPALKLHQMPTMAGTLLTLEEPDPRNYNWGSWVIHPKGHPSEATWIDWATSHHFNGALLGFADGHTQFKVWEDQRTREINWFYVQTPNNPDLQFLQSIYNTNRIWNNNP